MNLFHPLSWMIAAYTVPEVKMRPLNICSSGDPVSCAAGYSWRPPFGHRMQDASPRRRRLYFSAILRSISENTPSFPGPSVMTGADRRKMFIYEEWLWQEHRYNTCHTGGIHAIEISSHRVRRCCRVEPSSCGVQVQGRRGDGAGGPKSSACPQTGRTVRGR
jgi:hypothetical protein